MTTGALEGLLYCGNILIPSLFPFAVFSALAVKSGFAESFGKFLSPLTRKLFHTDGIVGTVILLGFTGGFPIGAKGVVTLYEEGKITRQTAQSLTMFTVGGGIGFTVTVIGVSLYRNIIVGLILWVCQILSQTLLGIIACRNIVYQSLESKGQQKKALSVCIVESTQSGVESMLALCGMVILFSCVFGILEDVQVVAYVEWILEALSLPMSISQSIISVLWEVTKGCNSCFNQGCPLWLMSFALGWGGICVHFQIFAAAESFGVKKMMFYFSRILNGAFTALLTFTAAYFLKLDSEVFSNLKNCETSITSNTFWGSAALLTASILFLIFMNSYIKTAKDNC